MHTEKINIILATDKKLNEVYEKYNSLFNSSSDSADVKTTNMEHKILRLLGEGLTSELIANRLNVSKRTIDNHRSHLMKKLKFKSGTELLRYAIHYNKIHNTDRTEDIMITKALKIKFIF